MIRPFLAAVALMVALTVPAAAASPRPFVNTIWMGQAKSQNFDRLRQLVAVSKQRGCTAISFDIHWSTERPDGSYDFTLADRLADDVTSRGMSLFIRLNTSLLGSGPLRWMSPEMLMQTPTGRVYTRNSPREAIPSITHRLVRRKMARFYTAAADHFARRFRGRPGGSPVVCYSAAFNLTMESEYPIADVDYSPSARQAFSAWLDERTRGKDLKELNAAWGTRLTLVRDVTLASAPPALRQQFYAHTLDELFTLLGRALRAGDPIAKLGVQFGCLWDHAGRRNMTVDLRNPAIDWIFVADAPTYNHAFTVDMLRASARGKAIANEIDGPLPVVMTNAAAVKQGLATLAHGADALFMCNWSLEKFSDRAQWTFPESLARAARQPAPPPRPRRALYVSSWDLVNLTARPEDYQRAYDKLTGAGSEAIDVLNDCALLADADRLAQYEQIVLPANQTIARDARAVLSRLPRAKLRVLQPDKAGRLDEFGLLGLPLVSPPTVLPPPRP